MHLSIYKVKYLYCHSSTVLSFRSHEKLQWKKKVTQLIPPWRKCAIYFTSPWKKEQMKPRSQEQRWQAASSITTTRGKRHSAGCHGKYAPLPSVCTAPPLFLSSFSALAFPFLPRWPILFPYFLIPIFLISLNHPPPAFPSCHPGLR